MEYISLSLYDITELAFPIIILLSERVAGKKKVAEQRVPSGTIEDFGFAIMTWLMSLLY